MKELSMENLRLLAEIESHRFVGKRRIVVQQFMEKGKPRIYREEIVFNLRSAERIVNAIKRIANHLLGDSERF